MISLEDIAIEIEQSTINLNKKIVQAAALKSLGVTIDSWGDIKKIDPTFLRAIQRTPEMKEAQKQLKLAIQEELKKQFSKTQVKAIAKKALADVSWKLTQQIKEQTEAKIEKILATQLDPLIKEYLRERPLIKELTTND